MLIPQAMGYAMIAGLPPHIGLYAAVLPLLVYSLLGTSRQLAVGPVAMVSLLTAAGIGAMNPANTSEYVAYAVLLAMLVGVMQTAMGLGRLGFLVNFLSHPVISGFTSAAALIIGFSQLKHLVGVGIPRSHHVHTILLAAIERASEINWITLTIGAASVAALIAMKRFVPRFPRALAVVIVGSLAVWAFGLESRGVAIVGDVPSGLPTPSLPLLDWSAIRGLVPTALTISLVGFMESISVAKNFARRNRYEVDANQELVGLGMANVAGGFFSAYPVTGGFSRTAVNAQAGAKTSLAGIITAVVIGLTLLFLTPAFYYLPKAVLAAIIVTAVAGLVDLAEVKHLWKVKRTDLALLGVTFVATLTSGIEEGILIGVAASLLTFVVRTTRPHIALLGQLPDSTVYRNVKRFPEARTFDGIMIVRLDAQFYFGNISFLKDTLRKLERDRTAQLRAVVIDASGMNQLDSSAETALRELTEEYAERNVKLFLANVKGPVRDVLRASHYYDDFGEDSIVLDLHTAVQRAREAAERTPRAAERNESSTESRSEPVSAAQGTPALPVSSH